MKKYVIVLGLLLIQSSLWSGNLKQDFNKYIQDLFSSGGDTGDRYNPCTMIMGSSLGNNPQKETPNSLTGVSATEASEFKQYITSLFENKVIPGRYNPHINTPLPSLESRVIAALNKIRTLATDYYEKTKLKNPQTITVDDELTRVDIIKRSKGLRKQLKQWATQEEYTMAQLALIEANQSNTIGKHESKKRKYS